VGWRIPGASVERRTDKLARLLLARDRTETLVSQHNPHAEPNHKPIGQNLFRTVVPNPTYGCGWSLHQAEMKTELPNSNTKSNSRKLATWPTGKRNFCARSDVPSAAEDHPPSIHSQEGIRHD
jgi:hypothetical protein